MYLLKKKLKKIQPLLHIHRFLHLFLYAIKNYRANHSYSQCGEDLIINYLFNELRISNPFYLDIGAHDPVRLSNTYLLYKKGCRGVCVEPDPLLFEKIRRKRKRDVCLNVGVGVKNEKFADFYIMDGKPLNTFSKEEAERYVKYGQRIENVIKVPLLTVNDIIRNNFDHCPNFISLDVEGLDLDIIKTFDFSRYRPEVFCIETITYSLDKTERKMKEIFDEMEKNNYFVYADTYINTIFVAGEAWTNE
jgi:FkbM family methyltransferase